MITWAEVSTIARRVLRWWWMIILAMGIAAGSAYYLSQSETRYYVARTSLMIGNTLESKIPDQNQLSIGSSLARYYSELARREPILGSVQESLHLPFSWQLISDRMLTTNVIASANLLEIYITDSNPERAAAIANAIGEQLIRFSPNAPDKIQAERAAVDQQLQESQKKTQEIQDKITELTNQQQSATSASDLAELNQKLTLLQVSLDQEQTSYKSLLNYKNTSIVNSLDFFERAVPPKEALPSKRKVIVGLAGLAGLMLSLAAIFVIERLDSRWRGPRDVEEQFKLDDLGSIPIGPPMLVAPETFVAERLRATRDVQTNILLAAAEQSTRILMLTSPQPSESRTSLAIDLADLFGRSGHRVLIVDADFTNSLLTQMLAQSGAAQNWTVMSGNEYQDLWAHLRPTPLANVALLPGRGATDGAPAMLPSLRWRDLIQRMLGAADLIIFDGPATLSGPDAALLAPHVDGVVLTLDPATDDRDDVEKSKTRLLRQKGARLLGAVTFTPARQRWRFGKTRQLGGAPLPLLPSPSPVEPQASVGTAAYQAPERAPIVTPPPDADNTTIIVESETIVHTPEPLEIADAPVEPSIGTEPVVPAAAQVDGAELVSAPPAERADQPNADTAAPKRRARRSRSVPKQQPPAEGAGAESQQG
jgi:succinoglycan biosynthesis transport protein ExoP